MSEKNFTPLSAIESANIVDFRRVDATKSIDTIKSIPLAIKANFVAKLQGMTEEERDILAAIGF